MFNVVCVLRESKVYNETYVRNLANAVKRNLPQEHRFICLNDTRPEREEIDGIVWEPLLNDWPMWWAKVEMWRPDLEHYGRFLFMDLDMVMTGDLTDIAAYDGPACVTYDFGYDVPSQTLFNFEPGAMRQVWDEFNSRTAYWIKEGDAMRCPYWGDQVLLSLAYDGPEIDKYQDIVPGQIVSFKMHCNEGLPPNARIVSFHGNPKPHGVSLDWVSKNWC